MASPLMRTVITSGGTITYQFEPKPVKNLNLRIHADGNVYVSANPSQEISQVDSFISKKADYIHKTLKHFEELAQYRQQGKKYVSGESFYIQGRNVRLKVIVGACEGIRNDGNYLELTVKSADLFERKKRIVMRYLDHECMAVFGEVMANTYPLFQKYGVDQPLLRIRAMETRWGSCLAKKGIITLNKRLIEAPRNCIEYVVLHEFCHFIHPNHSKQFYSFMTMLMPDWRERKALLDECAVYWL